MRGFLLDVAPSPSVSLTPEYVSGEFVRGVLFGVGAVLLAAVIVTLVVLTKRKSAASRTNKDRKDGEEK